MEYFLRKYNNNDAHSKMPKRKLYEDYTANEMPWYDLEAQQPKKKMGEGFLIPTNAQLRKIGPGHPKLKELQGSIFDKNESAIKNTPSVPLTHTKEKEDVE